MTHLRNLIIDGRVKKALFLLNNRKINAIELVKKDPENNTPLHWAVKFEYSEIVEILLNTEARLCKFVKNQQGHTPYDIAKRTHISSQLLLKLRLKDLMAANNDEQAEAVTKVT